MLVDIYNWVTTLVIAIVLAIHLPIYVPIVICMLKAVAPCRVIRHSARFIRERCRLSRLRYFSKAVSLQYYMKYNWQRASAESRDSFGMPRNKSQQHMHYDRTTTAKSLRFC